MVKEKKNVFEKVAEKLDLLLEELETANSILYALGSEMFDVGDKIDSLSAKVEGLSLIPLKVEVDYEKLADAIIMALRYTEVPEKTEDKFKFTEGGG